MRVALTGATGFIGGHAAAHFAEQGHDVRAIVRRAGSAPPRTREVHVPDLTDRAAVAAAVAGTDVVVHMAARLHVFRETESDPIAAFRRANVEATRVLAEESARAGVRHFVFLSSLSVVGPTSDAPWTESQPCEPENLYAQSKLEAEGVLGEIERATGFLITSLRAPLTYGPGVGANMQRLIRLVDRGIPLPFGAVRNLRSYIAVENLLAAIDAAIAAGPAARGTFFVSDERDISTPDLILALARGLGTHARLVPVPSALLAAVGRAGDLAGRFGPAPINTKMLRQLCGTRQVRTDRFRAATGFVPPVRAEDALAESAAAYRTQRERTAADGGVR
jgi:nucleoside-diphosphate-sugar epimerase